MPELLTDSGGENVSGIPGACITHNFTDLARGPWEDGENCNPGLAWRDMFDEVKQKILDQGRGLLKLRSLISPLRETLI